MLPPVPPRKSYDDIDQDSLVYALFLNPGLSADPVDIDIDDSLSSESVIQSNQQIQPVQPVQPQTTRQRPRKRN